MITLRGEVGRSFFTRGARYLERLLARSTANLTLHIEACCEQQRRHLDDLLRRLSRYGDRVSIWVKEDIRDLLCIDSSVFHLVLE